jgi:Na+-driven multidrug efflux pump/anti-sigma regulatory factor (Ser/Thr protein kinase)
MTETLISNDYLIKRIVGRYIIPGILAQLGVKLGNVINTIIIGQFYGADGLAVMSIVSPLELVMMSIGSLICVAGSIHAGFAIAKHDNDTAGKYYSASFWTVIVIALVVSFFGIIFSRDLALMLGADPKLHILTINGLNALSQFDIVVDYIIYLMSGSIFMIGIYLPMNFLKVIGHPTAAMHMLLIMSAVNIGCSLYFIGVRHYHIQAVAVSTVLSYAAAFIYGQIAFTRADSGVKIRRPGLYIFRAVSGLVSGVPSALNNVLRALLALCVNFIILYILPGNPSDMLSAVAVLNSVMGIVNAFVFGISQSTLQIAGIAYSERDYKTVNLAMKNIFVIGNIIVAVLALVIIVFSSDIGSVFGMKDTSASNFACICVGCYANLYLCNNIFTNFFSATKRNLPAIVIVSLRLSLFMLIPALIICLITWDGIGIWIGFLSAELLALLSILSYTYVKKRVNPNLSRFLLLDSDKLADITSENFSVKADDESAVKASEKITSILEESELPPKTIMRLSMAVEEIVVLVRVHAKIPETEYIDFRIVNDKKKIYLRVRYGGRDFNIVRYSYEHFDDDSSDAFGMNMLLKLTSNAAYNRALGVNNLLLEI